MGSVARTWREIPSVLSRPAKPLLGLVVLLAFPWLGLGSSARASFVVGQFGSDRAKSSAVPLDNEGTGCGTSSARTGHEDRPGEEESPWANSPSRWLLAAWPGLQTGSSTGGASAPGSASGPGGAGLVGILTLASPSLGPEGAERLFLCDERFKPPPFCSRLFRPPR